MSELEFDIRDISEIHLEGWNKLAVKISKGAQLSLEERIEFTMLNSLIVERLFETAISGFRKEDK